MSTRLRVVTGDTPQVFLTIKQAGQPVDLSDPETSILLKIREEGGSNQVVTVVPCVKLQGYELEDDTVTTGSPWNVAGKGGRVMAPCPSTLFIKATQYEGEVEVTFGSQGLISTPFELVRFVTRENF